MELKEYKPIGRIEARELRSLDYSKIEEKRKRKLSLKQRKFIKIYLETGSATEAAMRAYNLRSRANATTVGRDALKSIDFTELLELDGVSDKELAGKLREGLNATKTNKIGNQVPDFEIRAKYLTLALEAKKKIKNKLEVTGENGQPIRFNILAGHGFIPSISRSAENNATSTPGVVGRSTEVQDNNMAQKSQENNNSNNGASETGTT